VFVFLDTHCDSDFRKDESTVQIDSSIVHPVQVGVEYMLYHCPIMSFGSKLAVEKVY